MHNYAKDVFGVANVLNLQPLKLRVEMTLIGVFGVLEFVVFACENIFDVPFEDCDTFQGNCNVNIDIETIVSYLSGKKGTVKIFSKDEKVILPRQHYTNAFHTLSTLACNECNCAQPHLDSYPSYKSGHFSST